MKQCIVVEDDPFWAGEIRRMLEGEAIEVLCASTGLEALELAAAHPAAAIILDIILPDIDGLKVLERLQPRSCPVLAITSGGRMGPDFYLRLASQFGARGGLAKPFTDQQLLKSWRSIH